MFYAPQSFGHLVYLDEVKGERLRRTSAVITSWPQVPTFVVLHEPIEGISATNHLF
jgi:hypothetical protein